jgi:DegV family protein with EDD domain
VIGLVTDSNSQLTEGLRARYDVRVVPITVVVNGVAYREGVDLTVDAFYEALEQDSQISTSTPAPGEFLAAYLDAAAAGATEVVSVHVGANTSATISAARLGAAGSPVPVELVDSGSASFGVACCVWAAGDAIANGCSRLEVAAAARGAGARLGNVFLLRTLERARQGGRLADDVSAAGVPVLAFEGGVMRPVASVDDDAQALDVMVAYVSERAGEGGALRVGVGEAGERQLGDELAGRIRLEPGVDEVVRYRVGPSVAAHTGLGTVGAVFYRPEPAGHNE